MGRIYIDRYTGKIRRKDIYLVDVTLKDGTVIENLEPRRLFPVSYPDMYITLVDRDEHEICFVRHFEELDEESASALKDIFKDYYRIPHITRILSFEEKLSDLMWNVETDQGAVRFQIRNVRHDLKVYGKRVLIRDANDNRYEIPNMDDLDKHSRTILFDYL